MPDTPQYTNDHLYTAFVHCFVIIIINIIVNGISTMLFIRLITLFGCRS